MSAKKKRKKKKKSAALLPRLLIVVIVLALVGVAAWQLLGQFEADATTAIARGETLGNSYSGTVVIAREEETVFDEQGKATVDFVANEGSRVTRSSVICKVYSAGYNETEINRLETYREEIKNYHVSQVLSTYVDAALENDNEEIESLAQQVRTLVQGRGVGSLNNLENQLQSALSSRKNYLRQKYPDDQTLAELYKVENDQLKKIDSWTTTKTANGDCIVSFYTDGFETMVNSKTYENLGPDKIREVIRGVLPAQTGSSQVKNPIYRTVAEDVWYAVFLCTDRDWNPVKGEIYRMQLDGFDNYVLPAEVVSFSRVGGDLLVRMRIESSVEPVLNIRTCGATVGDFVSGVYVPINALYTYENMIGVVVLEGGMQTFVPVMVISYPDENTAFVRPTLSGSPLEANKTVLLF